MSTENLFRELLSSSYFSLWAGGGGILFELGADCFCCWEVVVSLVREVSGPK